jgi:hypothetical protein
VTESGDLPVRRGSLAAPTGRLDSATRARHVRGLLPVASSPTNTGCVVDPQLLPPWRQSILGRVLLQFYRAANLLYRRSVDGKAPAWVASLLDQGKPPGLIALQRDPAFQTPCRGSSAPTS